MNRIAAFGIGVTAVAALGLGEAQASSVYGLAADMSGSRTVGNGLVSEGSHNQQDWSNAWSDAEITWNITLDQNTGIYSYSYNITGLTGGAGLSHLVLDISENAVGDGELADPDAFTNATLNGDSWSDLKYTDGEFQHQENITGAVKYDGLSVGSSLDITFDSNRAPVWGHIHLKGGGGPSFTNLFNNAYDDDSASVWSNTQNFIARPNGTHIVPLPAAAWGGLALLSMLGVGQRLRKRRISAAI